jgi:hypothetical protein
MPGVPQGRVGLDVCAGNWGGALLVAGAPDNPPETGGGALDAPLPALPPMPPVAPPRCANAAALPVASAAASAMNKSERLLGKDTRMALLRLLF